MIKSFADKETQKVWNRRYSKKLPEDIQARARKKMIMVERAAKVIDLRSPPGNRLEKLGADRAGQWSIRINRQWRVCFDFRDGDTYDVEIVDYH